MSTNNIKVNPNITQNKILNKIITKQKDDTSLDETQSMTLQSVLAGHNVLITGPAGSGKSYLIDKIVKELKTMGKTPVVTSTTGSSSQLIGGRTVHSYLAIGIGTEPLEDIVRKIRMRKMKGRYKDIDTLIIDEISMMSAELLAKIELICRTIRYNRNPFGGLQIILVGDFYQLPFIESDVDKSFCFEHALFSKWFPKTFVLKRIYRTNSNASGKANQMWLSILEDARLGRIGAKTHMCLNSRKIDNCRKEYDAMLAKNLQPTRIYPRKIQVSQINTKELNKLEDENVEFSPELHIERCEGCKQTPSQIKAKLKTELAKLEPVTLCVNAQVMVTKNSKDGKLVNGTRGIVVNIGTNEVYIRTKDDEIHKIERVSEQVPHQENGTTWEATVSMIPLRLAWAVTIHKSQGMTLDLVECDMGNKIFEYGQAYVALSRVRNLDCIFIQDFSVDAFRASPRVREFYEKIS